MYTILKLIMHHTSLTIPEFIFHVSYLIVRGVQKAKSAYQWCTDSGIIDDMTESFPLTSSGKMFTNLCIFGGRVVFNATFI